MKKTSRNATLPSGIGKAANREIGVPGNKANHPGAAMKNGWKAELLGELCEFQRGLTYAKSDEVEVSDNVVLRATNIDIVTNLLDFSELKYISTNVVVPDSKKVKKGSLMICTASGSKSHLGKVAYIDDDYGYAFGGFMGMLTPKKGLVPKFLFHLMTSAAYKDFISGLSDGANINNLKFDDLKKFRVPLPPLPEQRRIVGILDKAFDAIAAAKANAEKNLQNARDLFESHLQNVFSQRGEGWVERRLGDLAAFRNGINFTKSSRGESVKIIGVKDFQSNYWAPLDNLDTVTTDGILPDSDILRENDLLFVRSNGNMELIGRCLLVGSVAAKITHSGFTIRMRLNGGEVMPQYLCHFLKSNNARREMIDSGIGTNIKSLNQATLSALVIPLPSRAVQIRIVDQLEAINAETQRLESLYRRKLAALDELKKSLLHRAFDGEL